MRSTSAPTAVNQSTAVTLAGRTGGDIVVAGTFVATFVAETSIDNGVTWEAHPIRSGAAYVASVNAPGRYYVDDLPETPGAMFRTRCSAFTSGAPSIVTTFR